MSTAMHRLQISLPADQLDYLGARARRDGISIAELLRRMVERESKADRARRGAESLWSIAGIAAERDDAIGDTPVSERVDLYLAAGSLGHAAKPNRRRRRAKRR
jgi:hypothetical protein